MEFQLPIAIKLKNTFLHMTSFIYVKGFHVSTNNINNYFPSCLPGSLHRHIDETQSSNLNYNVQCPHLSSCTYYHFTGKLFTFISHMRKMVSHKSKVL